MTTPQQPKSTLQSLITAHLPSPLSSLEETFKFYLDHDVYDVEQLAKWARRPYHRQDEFKQQLHACIHMPGMLPLETFDRWTNLGMDDQDDVQRELKEVWNACFPDEQLP